MCAPQCACIVVASVESSVCGVDSTTLRECVQVVVVGIELCRERLESLDLGELDPIATDWDQKVLRESWMVKGKSTVVIHRKDQGAQCRRNDIENGRWEMCARQVAIFAASEKYCTQIHRESE